MVSINDFRAIMHRGLFCVRGGRPVPPAVDIAAELTEISVSGRWSAVACLSFTCAPRRAEHGVSVRSAMPRLGGIRVSTPKALDALGDPFRPYRSVVA